MESGGGVRGAVSGGAGWVSCEMQRYGSRCGGMRSLPGCRAARVCSAGEARRLGDASVWGGFGTALAGTTAVLPPLAGCKGGVREDAHPQPPFGCSGCGCWARGGCARGAEAASSHKRQRKAPRAPFSSSDFPTVIKRLESSCSPNPWL